MTTSVLFYEHVASNWGDLAINTGAVELLRSAGADVEGSRIVRIRPGDAYARLASFSAAGPDVTDLQLGSAPKGGREELELLVEALQDPLGFAEEHGLLDHDAVLLNSGEHLFESSHGGNTSDMLWRLMPAIAAVMAQRTVVLLPSTLGPFSSRLGHAVDDFLTRSLTASAFRETESRRISPRGPSQERPVLLDPGFFAAGGSEHTARQAPERSEHLGIVLRLEEAGIRTGSRRSAFVQAKLRAGDYRDSQAFQLFHHVASRHLRDGGRVSITIQTRSDREISSALHAVLADEFGDSRLTLHDPDDFPAYLAAVRQADILVTSRFHAVILAESQGVPSIGVFSETHGHKMPGLLDLLGKPRCAVRLDERLPVLVADEVLSAMQEALQKHPDTQTRIAALRPTTIQWLSDAMGAPPRPGASAQELRVQALAALSRSAFRLAERTELDDLRRAVQKLTRAVTDGE